MVHLHDEDQPHYDDATIQMELQQFLDEWHYRMMHSGKALTKERDDCLMLAMDIFEMHGMVVTPEEKVALVAMDDEAAMVADMVKHIPMQARKTFEHFVLQLQLVVSTTTQVRHALDEGIGEEVARCFEGGDSGPGSQILKQCIIEAGKQIHEAIETHKSWKAGTELRVKRLMESEEEAEHARQQLSAITCQLDSFKGEQNAKSKGVLAGIAGKNDKALVHMCFSTWNGWLLQHKANAYIHEKFKQEIQDAEDALIAFKTKHLSISRGILARGAATGDAGLLSEVVRVWYQYVIVEGHTRAMDDALAEANAKFNNAQQSAKDASKAVMGRMSAGNDKALLTLCVQSWQASLEELRKDKEIDALAKDMEAKYKDMMQKKNGEAKGVLDRMSGASETGLLHMMIEAWVSAVREEKAGREMEEKMKAQGDKFKSLNQRQKGNAKSVASKCHQQEEENMMMVFFYAWSVDTKTEVVIKKYGEKLDAKKGQLDAVQTMFRSFASQLEQGIGNTPRTGGSRSRKGAGSDVPPALPAA